eukprot:1181703-Prorocentrum_minimum.AAC.5
MAACYALNRGCCWGVIWGVVTAGAPHGATAALARGGGGGAIPGAADALLRIAAHPARAGGAGAAPPSNTFFIRDSCF